MSCYREGGCGPYEMRSCAECPASRPEYASEMLSVRTNGDRHRAMTDEELAEWLFMVYRATMEQDGGGISHNWCDSKGCDFDDEGMFVCTDELHKACILRWLRSEAKS